MAREVKKAPLSKSSHKENQWTTDDEKHLLPLTVKAA